MTLLRRRRPRRHRSWILVSSWILLGLFVIVGVFAPLISPYPPNAQTLSARLKPPLTPGHLLGTDMLGRDVTSRLLYGAQMSLSVGVLTVLVTVLLGVAIGLISGYFGGPLDTFIMRVIDVWLAFPFLLLAVALVTALGGGYSMLVAALVLAGWPGIARPVRGEVMQLIGREYVLSAKALGVSRTGVMAKHLLPNVTPTVLVLGALDLGHTILAMASLSFLGLGLGPETPTWGGMLADGRNYVSTAWWLALFPGLAIFLVVMAVNLIGDWLRDRYDPRSPFRAAARSADDEDGTGAVPESELTRASDPEVAAFGR